MNDMRLAERTVDTKGKPIKFSCRNVQVFYGDKHAIKDVDVDLEDKTVTAFIGPSGCGKSTFLRCLNRMNDTIDVARVDGKLMLEVPEGAAAIAPVVRALDDAEVLVESLDLVEPTLDDVFVEKTGEHLEGAEDDAAASGTAAEPEPEPELA